MPSKPFTIAAAALGLMVSLSCAEKKQSRRAGAVKEADALKAASPAPVDQDEPGSETSAASEASTLPTPTGDAGSEANDPVDDVKTPDSDQAPAPPADALSRSDWYRARFEPKSLRGIRDGQGYRVLGRNLEDAIRARLVTQTTDGLLASETYGDGAATRLGTRELISSAMDQGINSDASSNSGVRKLDETRQEACPEGALCVSRLVLSPFAGEPKTLCFTKPASSEAIAYPYGARSDLSAAQAEAMIGEHGPYVVRAFAGKDVDCAAPDATPLSEETMGVSITSAAPASMTLMLHTIDPLPLQLGIAFEHHRTELDLMSPYSDETIGLEHRAQYFLNTDKKQIVAMRVTSRQSINIAEAAGGGLIGGLIRLFTNIDGITIDQSFELCQDMLDEQATSHCPPAG